MSTVTSPRSSSRFGELPVLARSLVAGEWRVDTSSGEGARVDPYGRTVVSKAANCGSKEVRDADAWARRHAAAIGRLAPFRRAEVLERTAESITENGDDLAKLESLELGKPLRDTRGEMERAAESLAVAAHEVRRLGGEVLPTEGWPRGASTTAFCYRVPVGVVLAITPFNAPINLLAHKIAASFGAGNTTIVKPPPQAPAVTSEFVRLLLESGLPSEAVQILHGDAELGAELTALRCVRAVAFTGSASAGDQVARTAGAKRTVLELGGNAATVVCADADIAAAARICARTGYSNSGQSCISVQRVYVERPVYDAFLDAFCDEVRTLRVGDPLQPDTDIGSMVDDAAAARVEAWVKEAVSGGARLRMGGDRTGATLSPTVLAEPQRDARVVAEEVFGDLVSVLAFDDFSRVIDEVNATPYGLQGGLFTRDLFRVFEAIRRIEVGALVVNGSSSFRLDHVPFGGVKASGLGREAPRWMIEDFTALKTVIFRGLSLWS
jgi:acyl-CoA reductase-like NAD-dependent aldehyde dehydrogenase